MSDIKYLINGYNNFFKKIFLKSPDKFKKLSKEQSPKILLISCVDSRVDPAIITNAKLGEIMVVRNVANIVPSLKSGKDIDSTLSAIEFAVKIMKVNNIVVLGHSNCAGIKNLIYKKPNNKNLVYLNQWLEKAKDIRCNITHTCLSSKKLLRVAEKENIRNSLNNLMSYPWIKKKVKEKTLSLNGLYFSIETGLLYQYDNKKSFTKVKL